MIAVVDDNKGNGKQPYSISTSEKSTLQLPWTLKLR